ncbi:hypothetical protein Leryth_022966 [Lithospermum erythrorhizon]|nr:hypothetical protein Leryth_022966 [Lithospermum erythrorhizon]
MEIDGRGGAEASSQPTPPAEELLKKIKELEAGHAHLKHEMSKLMISSPEHNKSGSNKSERQRSHSISPQRPPRRRGGGDGGMRVSASFRHSSPLQRESKGGGASSAALNFADKQYLNILHSMGQSVHIFDLNCKIIYWNPRAEHLYGYSPSEALGQDAVKLLTDSRDFTVAKNIVQRASVGENWTGRFPVKNKRGDRFIVVATNTPFYDDDGGLAGIICVSSDSQSLQGTKLTSSETGHTETDTSFSRTKRMASEKLGLDPQQPLQVALASKISNLACKMSNKVKSKMRTGENTIDREGGSGESHGSDHGSWDAAHFEHKEDANSSGPSTPRGDIHPSPFGVFSHSTHDETSSSKPFRDSGDESEEKPGISKIITSKAEALMGKTRLPWPFKGQEREGSEIRTTRFSWPWAHNEQENDLGQPKSSASPKKEDPEGEYNRAANNEASGSWSSSFNIDSTSSASSCGSTTSSTVNKLDIDTDGSNYEIMWEELTIGEQIGQGSCGSVYHALWYGSDVAVKVFSKQEYSDDLIYAFRQEVSLMKKLRHPNILLFMGAVTSPQRLCIVTEFLPRGSLFRLLQRNMPKLDWRRRIQMALDIARGMNYLHHCNPPIVHRDLKTSNLLVDKNWTVKVGDFGLSRLKHETYLTTKTGKGTVKYLPHPITSC